MAVRIHDSQSGSGAEQRKGEKTQGPAIGLGPCGCREAVPASLSSQHGREEVLLGRWCWGVYSAKWG